MAYFLGIDVGTSGVKCVTIDTYGRIVGHDTKEYPLIQPQNGWAEQNAEIWWNATVEAISASIKNAEIKAIDILAIGVTGQMHGLVLLDKNGNVIRNPILWCDQRTAFECGQMEQTVGRERLMEITCSPAATGFTASKLLWVRNNEPVAFGKARTLLLPKDYIRYKLTGEYAMDVSDASGTQLFDISARDWSAEVIGKLEIDRTILPKVYESVEIVGKIGVYTERETGLRRGIPVVAGAGDNAASAVVTGAVTDGASFLTIGSSGVLYTHTKNMVRDAQGRIHTFCAAVPNEYHVMGVTQGAGLSLKWLAATLSSDYAEMDALAETVPPGADRLLFLPYLMGERTPHLNPDCRGVFFGLSALHERKHLVRAVLEGVAYSMRDCMEELKDLKIEELTICGGGATSSLWRQIICDTLNLPARTTKQNGASYGAAILAAVGVGEFDSVSEACKALIHTDSKTKPEAAKYEVYSGYYTLYKKLYHSLKDDFTALSNL